MIRTRFNVYDCRIVCHARGTVELQMPLVYLAVKEVHYNIGIGCPSFKSVAIWSMLCASHILLLPLLNKCFQQSKQTEII